MITSRPSDLARRSRRGFTLVEMMIGAALGSMTLGGVLSAYIMLVRSGVRASNYATMETHSRRSLEQLGIDLRMASNISWTNTTSITLTVPNNYTSTSNQVTYSYDSATKQFRMSPAPNGGASGSILILARNVSALTFTYYDRTGGTAGVTPATTKRVHISMTLSTSVGGSAGSSQMAAGSYTLRNKDV
jgi:prepilin-type N-terminal cleavage/methylation domain-containing protein